MKHLVLALFALAALAAGCHRIVELSPALPDGAAHDDVRGDGPGGDAGVAEDDALLDGGIPAD